MGDDQRSRMQGSNDIRDLWPDPPKGLQDRLFHFVDSWPEVDDEQIVLMASVGVYGRGAVTGLTMGDIRTLANREALGSETVAYGPQAQELGRQLRRRIADEEGRRAAGEQGP